MMGFLQRGFAYGNRRGFAIPLYVPELKVEEQVEFNEIVGLDGHTGGKKWAGQHFWHAPNRKIATLAFYLVKLGNPTGDVTFIIREHPTDIVLLSKVWGDASDVPTDLPPLVWTEAKFDAPTFINVVAEMVVQFSGGDGENQIAVCRQSTNVKPDEEFVMDVEGHDPTKDAAYQYKYRE
ncbi:unnamed protein product [marine sediment metagenome]|uniref:Uncharacterized protein n=1 Tax=marine sediment metagenome TaxID=412755 RepID=X1QJA9_9ZZZZ